MDHVPTKHEKERGNCDTEPRGNEGGTEPRLYQGQFRGYPTKALE